MSEELRRYGTGVPEAVLRAVSFAARRHDQALRKDRETPYAAHPMRVLFLLSHVFGVRDPEVLAAAVLHDTVEDTTTDRDDIAREFGERVADIVARLTKDKRLPEAERERLYLEVLEGSSSEVQIVKLADVLDNLIDSHVLASREKTVRKSREILERLGPRLGREWQHAVEIVRGRMG